MEALLNIGKVGPKFKTMPVPGDQVPPPHGEEPSFGEDNFDIRNKSRAAAGSPVYAPPGATYEQLKQMHQVNPDHAEALDEIEDADLQQHMRQARENLKRQLNERGVASLPDIQERDRAARQAVSSLMTQIKEIQMEFGCVSSDIINQTQNVPLVAGDKTPYGYPDTSGKAAALARCFRALESAEATPVENKSAVTGLVSALDRENTRRFAHMEKKLSKSCTELEAIAKRLEALEKELTLIRRGYEFVVDGYAANYGALAELK